MSTARVHRRLPLPALLLGAGAMLLGVAPAVVRADETAAFPEVAGINLDGHVFALPGDLEGELNLVLLAFQRDQQADVDTWIPLGEELEATHARFRLYQVPALPSRIRFMRPVIDGGMRKGIDDPATRTRTITLYTDRDALRAALAIPGEDSVHALLLDRSGAVVWRAEGRCSDEVAAELARLLATRL